MILFYENTGFGFRFEYIQFIMTMSEELGTVSGGGQGNSAQDKQDIMMQLTLFVQGIIKVLFRVLVKMVCIFSCRCIDCSVLIYRIIINHRMRGNVFCMSSTL